MATASRPRPPPRPTKGGASRAGSAAGRAASRPRPRAGSVPPPEHLVGPVPPVAWIAAGLALAAALALVVAGPLRYADVGGSAVRAVPLAVLAGLVWPLVLAVAALVVLTGRLPRAGLAAIAVGGALAVGLAATEAYQLLAAGSHRAVEVFLGQRLVTSELTAGPGVLVTLAAYLLLALALAAALAAWPRTTMEDVGDFDPFRPRAFALSAVAALAGALAVVAPTHTAPEQVVESLSGLRTTLDVPADVALPERLALDLLGGSLLAAAVVVTALLAATLRPRLASVGAYAGLAAYFGSAGLVAVTEAVRYDDLLLGPGGWLSLLAGAAFAAVAGWALRVRAEDGGAGDRPGGPGLGSGPG